MIAIPEYLEKPFLQAAESEHKPADSLLAQLIESYLEDYHDLKQAEKTLEQVEHGEMRVYSLADAMEMLGGVDN